MFVCNWALILAMTLVGPEKKVDYEFRRAVEGWDAEKVRTFIANGADIAQKDDFGNGPLHWAARLQRTGSIEVLLAAGADVNACNQNRETALHTVICQDDRWNATVDLLLSAKGVDLEIKDKHGQTVLDLASHPKSQTAKRLLAMGAKDSIHAAIKRADPVAIEAFLAGGADVNAVNERGVTLLMHAAANGDSALIRLLVDRGAKKDVFDVEGRTAMMVAAYFGRVDAVKLLADLGADVNATRGRTGYFLNHAVTRFRQHPSAVGDANELARFALEHPKADAGLRACARLWQGDYLYTCMTSEPRERPATLVLAEQQYRQAIAEGITWPGVEARWRLSEMLLDQKRDADAVELLAGMVSETNALLEGKDMSLAFYDNRHTACEAIADACIRLNRLPEALKYARLARDKHVYRSFCGVGYREHLDNVAQRVKKLEQVVRE